MSVHVEGVFMAGNMETLEKTKENINLKINIQESGKVKKFLGVYYEWVRDAKGSYTKTTMEKDVNKLVEVYKKYTGIDVKVQKTPVAPDTTPSKSNFEEPQDIYKYRSLMRQSM